MTSDVTKGSKVIDGEANNASSKTRPNSHSKPINSKNNRKNGYSRVKGGDLKRRRVTRNPDMSNPNARALNPNVSIGSVPAKLQKESKIIPVAGVRVEPTVRTVTDTTKVPFPYSIVFLSLICSLLFFYMIFNYVQINEHTSAISDLKSEIATLSFEADELTTKLDMKNDITYIEKVATEKLGMVKIDEIVKKYITMDPGDVINPTKSGTSVDSVG